MENFKGANPVALVTRGVYHGARGDRKRGKELCRKGVKNTALIVEGVVNATPLVGHAKGIAHYACGDKRGGNKAMLSATRATAGIAGAAGGMIASGPPGAVVGYVAGTNGSDAVISGTLCTVRIAGYVVVGGTN